MKTTIAPPILTLVEYGSVIGSRRYQPVLFVASTALSVCLQHSVSELRSDRSGSLPAGSITDTGISGPAHSPEQYNSGTVTFSYFVPRSFTGQTYRRFRRRFLQDAAPQSTWNGTNSAGALGVCQSCRSRFTRHFKTSLSEAKRGIVLQDH